MLGRGVSAAGYGLNVFGECLFEWRGEVGELGDESGPGWCQAQTILSHDDTTVTSWPSPATEDWDVSIVHNGLCHFWRHRFKKYRGGSGGLHLQA